MELYPELDQTSWLLAKVSLALALAGSVMFFVLFKRARYLFVKPTFIILGFYHILVQWPFVMLSGFLSQFVRSPWSALLLVHGFVLFGLILSFFTWQKTTANIWRRLDLPAASSPPGRRQMWLLVGLAVVFSAFYLRGVPWDKTGLYALLNNPADIGFAREESLKLLTDPLARWAQTLLIGAVAPLLIGCVAALIGARATVSIPPKLFWLGIAVIVAAQASMSGAKSILVYLVLTALLVGFWRAKLSFSFVKIVVLLLLGLLPALLFLVQIASSSDTSVDAWSLDGLMIYAGAIAKRAFVLPALVGIWYVDYAQSIGPVGIGGIARVAGLVGVAPVNLPNLVGLTYGPLYYNHDVIDSISANSGFLFAFYGYFGLWGLPLALLALLSCDLVLYFVWNLPDNWIPTMLAVMTVSSMKFVQSDFLTVWLTHGFGVAILLAWGVSRLLPAAGGIILRPVRSAAVRAAK